MFVFSAGGQICVSHSTTRVTGTIDGCYWGATCAKQSKWVSNGMIHIFRVQWCLHWFRRQIVNRYQIDGFTKDSYISIVNMTRYRSVISSNLNNFLFAGCSSGQALLHTAVAGILHPHCLGESCFKPQILRSTLWHFKSSLLCSAWGMTGAPLTNMD